MTGVVYARKLGQQSITLGVSGKLLDRTVIFFDRETGTEWSQLTAKGLKGPLKGKSLKRIPVLHTTWKYWKSKHPETEVLQPVYPMSRYRRTANHYQRLFDANRKSKLLGVAHNGHARSWTFSQLRSKTVINDSGLGGKKLLIVTDKNSDTAAVYNRTIKGKTLHFQRLKGGVLVDKETKSQWDPGTMKADSGPLKGQALAMIPSTHVHKGQWKAYFPKSSSYGAKAASRPSSRPTAKKKFF